MPATSGSPRIPKTCSTPATSTSFSRCPINSPLWRYRTRLALDAVLSKLLSTPLMALSEMSPKRKPKAKALAFNRLVFHEAIVAGQAMPESYRITDHGREVLKSQPNDARERDL